MNIFYVATLVGVVLILFAVVVSAITDPPMAWGSLCASYGVGLRP